MSFFLPAGLRKSIFTKNNERYIGFKKLKKGKMMLRFSVITYTFGRLTTKKHNKVMKKLIFLFAFCLTVTNIFAQTDPSQLKKEDRKSVV